MGVALSILGGICCGGGLVWLKWCDEESVQTSFAAFVVTVGITCIALAAKYVF